MNSRPYLSPDEQQKQQQQEPYLDLLTAKIGKATAMSELLIVFAARILELLCRGLGERARLILTVQFLSAETRHTTQEHDS